MADTEDTVTAHYGRRGLYDRILGALAETGVAPEDVTAEHLKAVDEFHIGGVAATERLLDPLGITGQTRTLDLGCGIGGPARFMAGRYGARVTGIDLTPEFVDTAERLTALTGQDIRFVTGSVLDLPFGSGEFDLATLIHVGMNLPDKPRLFAEAHRVLDGRGRLVVYDVMRFGAHPAFPLPWSGTPEGSFLETPDAYLAAADAAGFTLAARTDRGDVARTFFQAMSEAMERDRPQAVGLPILMGADAPAKLQNMIAAVNAGDIQPVEMTFEKG